MSIILLSCVRVRHPQPGNPEEFASLTPGISNGQLPVASLASIGVAIPRMLKLLRHAGLENLEPGKYEIMVTSLVYAQVYSTQPPLVL